MHIGLGIGINRVGFPPSASAENAIKAALEERHHIRAIRGGNKVLIQPYALFSSEGAKFMRGVVVVVDGGANGEWRPEDINIADLSGVEAYNERFIPSDAFDPGSVSGAIAIVESFDPFQGD